MSLVSLRPCGDSMRLASAIRATVLRDVVACMRARYTSSFAYGDGRKKAPRLWAWKRRTPRGDGAVRSLWASAVLLPRYRAWFVDPAGAPVHVWRVWHYAHVWWKSRSHKSAEHETPPWAPARYSAVDQCYCRRTAVFLSQTRRRLSHSPFARRPVGRSPLLVVLIHDRGTRRLVRAMTRVHR